MNFLMQANLLIGTSRMLFGLADITRVAKLFQICKEKKKLYNKIMTSKLIRKAISTSNAPKAAGPYR